MREEISRIPVNMVQPDVFNLEMAGVSYCDGAYRMSRKRSKKYIFEYVISGKGYLWINSQEFFPKSGDVYIAHYGSDHEYGSSAGDPWEKIWFNVAGTMVRNLMNAYGLNTVYHVEDCDVEGIFRRGLEKVREDGTRAHYHASLTIHEIILHLSSTIHQRKGAKRSPEALKLKEFLDARVGDRVPLRSMGDVIAKSPSQTIRIFKNEWGMTPYQYLLDKKIQAARLLLVNTVKSIKEIAYETGFCDEYYFSNAFKKKVGTSPSHYRRAENEFSPQK